MSTMRQRKAQQAIREVTGYMQQHSGEFKRIPDVCDGTGLPVPAVNNALRSLYNAGVVVSEMRRKALNGKPYPVYLYYNRQMPTGLPHWLSPPVPDFTQEQLREVRTILGFTGNMEIKKAIEESQA